ncbi:hypothetical protein [Luteitalea sp. TBR-22]|uniref:hypothetical protein n=1 Tax=Luteitalea sp. TBR-22 TaxID=2802971 RepID=UPI001EF5AA45|nr:hypothetical protein [Luteitalea sp. TBR-22]
MNPHRRARRAARRVGLLGAVALVACGACSGGSSPAILPTLPSGLQTGLQPGAYTLEVSGEDAVGGDPQLPGCSPPGQPPAGKRITIAGTVSRDGEDWVFRSDRPGTDLVLRLRVATRSFSSELFAVEGSLRGSAPDDGAARAASGLAISAGAAGEGGAASVDGEIRLTGAFVNALAQGRVTFSDAAGARATCNRVAVSMQPGRPR